jgi:glucose/arabinose dehydrogenase
LFVALIGCLGAAPAFASEPRVHEFPLIQKVVVRGLDSPVSMAIAPDGRVFVCEQAGRLRVVRGGRLLPRPFAMFPTVAFEEEGLLGVAFSPTFEHDRFVYVCYTAQTPARHSVIARVTAAGDSMLPGSLRVLFECDAQAAHQHVAGALRFGLDGMLYASTGEGQEGDAAQSLRSTAGKILRITPQGGIPDDGPFAHIAKGRYRAIWARGLRNPFTFDIHPVTGRMFINDVGGDKAEEIDDGLAGANYGWPLREGASRDTAFMAPVYAYDHTEGCAITGGAWYAPQRAAFGREWEGRYFFADYCKGEIRWLAPEDPAHAHVFAQTLLPGPVDLRVSPDGALYVLVRGAALPTGSPHDMRGALLSIIVRDTSQGR